MDPTKNRRLLNGCALDFRGSVHVSSLGDALKLMSGSATSKRGLSRTCAAPARSSSAFVVPVLSIHAASVAYERLGVG
jgi:hypothetical protein